VRDKSDTIITHPFLGRLLGRLLLGLPCHLCRLCLTFLLLLCLLPHRLRCCCLHLLCCLRLRLRLLHLSPPLRELRFSKRVVIVGVLHEAGVGSESEIRVVFRHDGGLGVRINGLIPRTLYIRISDFHFSVSALFLANGLQGFRPKGGILSYPSFSQVQLRPSEPTPARSGLVRNSKTSELGYASTLVLSIHSYYLSPNILVPPPCIIRASAPPSSTFVPGALLPIQPP
jgi:hypothetical protein